MPKRSANEKIELYEKKIRKLRYRQSVKRRRVRFISSDSSDSEGTDVVTLETTAELHNYGTDGTPVLEAVPASPLSETNLAPEDVLSEPVTTDLISGEPELDAEVLEALGESTSDNPEFGDKVHENLSKLWLPLLRKGLPKEKREKLLKDYLIPDNCRLLQAPKLNAEISAAVPDTVRNRDKALKLHQQQLGHGITAVNRALNLLLNGDEKRTAIQHLSNACRILSDLHATNTNSRIKLLTPSLDKSFLHVIQDTERDETLFGNKLSEKIKAAKAIEKQGLQIKKANPKTTTFQASGHRPQSSGNWSAPPRYPSIRGGRGGKKTAAPNRRPYQNSTQQTAKPPAANKPRAPTPQ